MRRSTTTVHTTVGDRSSKTAQLAAGKGVRGFNYESLKPEARKIAEGAAAEIRQRQAGMARSVFEIGRALLAVRRKLGKKLFAAWRQVELGMPLSHASRYMLAAKTFSDDTCFESFSPHSLFLISAAKVPPEVREKALGLANAGTKITSTKINGLLAEHELSKAADEDEAPDPTPASIMVSNAKAAVRSAIRAWPCDAQYTVAVRMAAAIREAFEELGFGGAFDEAAFGGSKSRGGPLGLAASLAIGAPALLA